MLPAGPVMRPVVMSNDMGAMILGDVAMAFPPLQTDLTARPVRRNQWRREASSMRSVF